MSKCGFDIIGDVHGCAFTLVKLLEKLQYVKERFDGERDAYWHPERKAVFVGDIVDRGPHIREALHIIKNMVDAGTAYCVMGNHEYNALAYTMEAPPESGRRFVREHNRRNNRIIAETLTQFASFPEEWRMFLDWFQTLPVFLEFDDFRVVHACWDHALIKTFKETYNANCIDKAFIRQSWNEAAFAGRFINRLTRGTTLTLPSGRMMTSRDGFQRKQFRTKFWSDAPATYKDVVFQPDPLPEDLLNREISESEHRQLLNYQEGEIPVFVGHYWLQGTPLPLQQNVACLDYSAVKFGRLVAYRFDCEPKLEPKKFVWVYVDPK
ncbi:MAG: metallophosphoesterase [Cellvibrionaceae bacterium]|nr:metallophosphoesterase [Cellvibrionaceae bacterium]